MDRCKRCERDVDVTVTVKSSVFGFWKGRSLCLACIEEQPGLVVQMLPQR